ncbi:hypothetical protein L596_024814 [Steinernema carpocapsae]|nr:hypothetical protein L596_024814 [Steinernema carpocapsae]
MTTGCPEAASRLPAFFFVVFFLATFVFVNCFKNKEKNPYKAKTLGDASKPREKKEGESESENQGSSSNTSKTSNVSKASSRKQLQSKRTSSKNDKIGQVSSRSKQASKHGKRPIRSMILEKSQQASTFESGTQLIEAEEQLIEAEEPPPMPEADLQFEKTQFSVAPSRLASRSRMPNTQQCSVIPRSGAPPTGPRPVVPVHKDRKKTAGTFDTNYQTITGLSDPLVDKLSSSKPTGPSPVAPPLEQRNLVAETRDPNYQTITGLPDPFADKLSSSKPTGLTPVAPPVEQRRKVDSFDPNYQTMQNINNEIFGQSKAPWAAQSSAEVPLPMHSRSKLPIAPADRNKVVRARDPQYQTMLNLNNDCFKQKPVAPLDRDKKVDKFDPNYQTLNILTKDMFAK